MATAKQRGNARSLVARAVKSGHYRSVPIPRAKVGSRRDEGPHAERGGQFAKWLKGGWTGLILALAALSAAFILAQLFLAFY